MHKQENRITDMNGKYALLSTEFVYFGDGAILLPKSLRGILHKNQGHRSRLNADHLPAFLRWWKTRSQKVRREASKRECPSGTYSRTERIWAPAQTRI